MTFYLIAVRESVEDRTPMGETDTIERKARCILGARQSRCADERL